MRAWIEPYLKQNKIRILLAIMLGVLGVGSGVMLLFISGYLISKSALQPVNIMVVYVPIVSVRAFSIGQAAFLYVEKLISHDIALRILEKMRSKLYRIIEPQALFLKSHFQTGDLLSILSDDIEHLQDLYLRTIFPGILGLVIYTVIVIVFGMFDIFFAIILALMLGILVFLIPIISFFLKRKYHSSQKQSTNSMYEQLTDAMFGITDWLASGRQSEWEQTFFTKERQLLEVEKKILKYKQIRDAFSQIIIGIIVITMIIWTSIQANHEIISPTVIAAFILMIFAITDALLPMSEAIERIPTYVDSINRINSVDLQTQKGESREFERETTDQININIKNIKYHYPKSKNNIINNLSLTIKHGEKVAVLGKSGAGKSTLLKLLAGTIEPTEGQILFNGKIINSSIISKELSILNQKPHLFSTSIANNIRIGRPDATDEEIEAVIEQAQLTSLIKSLPEGMHTQMKEMGQRFSGGERQRIAFARVLIQNTPIILIDEATIGLDPIKEKELIKTILQSTENKTIIWITHHLTGLKFVDSIIFLKDGQTSMYGSHKELMKTNSYYRTLHNLDQGN